jgi:hypothetical protein
MVPRKHALLLVLLISLPVYLSAQRIVSSTSHKVDFRIPYCTTDGQAYDNGNALLREMAKDVLREPWLVRILVSCELRFDIATFGERNLLSIVMKRPVIRGDTVYRHFAVGCALVPSRISMKLRWANRADTSGYTEESLTGKPFPRNDSLVCAIPVAPFNPVVDTLMIREVEFFYDSLAVKAFFKRIELIHDYYASCLLLDSLENLMAGIRFDNPELLPVNYFKVQEVSRVIERIDACDFPGKLLQNGYDPMGLMAHHRQMFKQSRSLIYNFIDGMRKTGVIPWDGDADRLAGYFISRVLSYVGRSFLMDQQQGRIYNDCLDHFFDSDAFPPEEDISGMMLAKMYPGAAQDTIARYISGRFYASYQGTAQRLIDGKRYAEAFSVLENGRHFIARNPFLKDLSADDRLQSVAAEGILDSYLGIASSCIGAHKYNMADAYLQKADQYARVCAKYIRSDSGYRVVFSRLFFLRNADCDQLLDQQKYAEALDCYRQFEKAYSERDLALVSTQLDEKKSLARAGLGRLSAMLTGDALKRQAPDSALFYYEQAVAFRNESRGPVPADTRLDSLAPLMAHIRYEHIFREGSGALQKRQFTLAVARLKEARMIADSAGFERSREFDSLYLQAMKNWLIVQLSASQKKIWANRFDSARMALEGTRAAGFDFGLLNEPDFIAAMDRFTVKIQEQHCRNLQDSVNLRMIRADRNIALGNFVNGMAYMEQALAEAGSLPGCTAGMQSIRDSLAKYRPAAAYQQKLADAGALVSAGNYAEAVCLLDEARQAFGVDKLSRFGLQQPDNYGFIREKNNPYLTEKAAKYYASIGKPREAFDFLLLARDQGLAARSAAAAQEELGRTLAREDFQVNQNDSAIESAAKYNSPDGWLDLFRASYHKEWNRLVKAGNSGLK